MIRIFPFSEEKFPSALIDSLFTSSKVDLLTESPSADLILIYSKLWNRRNFERIHQRFHPFRVPVLVICDTAEEPFSSNSIRRGEISGVLPSKATASQVLAAAHAILQGLKVFHDSTQNTSFQSNSLTARELEVLNLIADGEGNKSIAYFLDISEHTVKFHISSIFEKLNVSSRTEAVKAAITRGLISI